MVVTLNEKNEFVSFGKKIEVMNCRTSEELEEVWGLSVILENCGRRIIKLCKWNQENLFGYLTIEEALRLQSGDSASIQSESGFTTNLGVMQ